MLSLNKKNQYPDVQSSPSNEVRRRTDPNQPEGTRREIRLLA